VSQYDSVVKAVSQHRLVQLSSGNLPFCAQAMRYGSWVGT